ISTDSTSNMACSAGVCSPTANKAILNVNDLETLLASGDTTVETTGSGVQAKDIRVATSFSWSTTSTLTLDAYDSIAIDRAVAVAGTGGLALLTNDGGAGGALAFASKGSVSFANLTSQLTINDTGYSLVNSIGALANAIAANPSGAYALANSYDASA